MILTTMQAASLKINSRDFTFGIYAPEIKIVECNHARKIEQNMHKAGFVAEYVSSEHGYTIRTGRGGVPSFAPTGFLAMEEASKIFGK